MLGTTMENQPVKKSAKKGEEIKYLKLGKFDLPENTICFKQLEFAQISYLPVSKCTVLCF